MSARILVQNRLVLYKEHAQGRDYSALVTQVIDERMGLVSLVVFDHPEGVVVLREGVQPGDGDRSWHWPETQ